MLLILGMGTLSSCLLQSTIEACNDMTLQEVKAQNDVSDNCRAAVVSLLERTQDNFRGRVISMGNRVGAGNQPTVYFHAVKNDGTTLTAAEIASNLSVKVTISGIQSTLPASQYTVTPLSGSAESLLSVSMVSDYSGSMRDRDIDTVSEIYTEIFQALPTIYEAEHLIFSHRVVEKQAFTSTPATVLASVLRDSSIDRSSTALYDGMGTGVTHLIARSLPMRVLILSSDGLENASSQYTKSQLRALVSDNKIVVIAIGALFSDIGVLKDLAGSRGVFFWGQDFVNTRDAITRYAQSLKELVKVELNSAYQSASQVTITTNGLESSFSF